MYLCPYLSSLCLQKRKGDQSFTFAHEEVTKFVTDAAVTDFLKSILEEAQSGQPVPQARLKDAMYIVAGGLMLRYLWYDTGGVQLLLKASS